MPRYKRLYKLNTYYHLYKRGNRKHRVFYESTDYEIFLKYINYYSGNYDIYIAGYCLMPNHFHLAVKSLCIPENISKMMQCSMTKFCVYINLKYKLVGRSFQGTYKHREIIDDKDFSKLMQYFKDNPVKSGLVKDAELYRWLKTPEKL